MAAQKSRMNRRIHQAKVQNNNERNCSTPLSSFKFKVYFHLFHPSAWERCVYFTIDIQEVLSPKGRFPRVLSRCFPDFERGDIWAVVSRCLFRAELVRIVFVLIKQALTKNATETYFVDLNFYEKTFAACKDPFSQATHPPFTRKTLGSHGDEVAHPPPRNFEPAIIVVVRSGLFASCHA